MRLWTVRVCALIWSIPGRLSKGSALVCCGLLGSVTDTKSIIINE